MKPTLKSALALCASALAAACTSTPTLPGDFELKRATLAAGATNTLLVLDGPGSRSGNMGSSALKGSGIGFVLGGLACIGTGPLAPLCLGTLVPASTVVGAASGAAVAAVRSESAADIAQQRAALDEALAVHPGLSARLTALLQQSSGPPPPAAALPAPEWQVQVDVTELAAPASGPSAPYALRLAATLTLRRAGIVDPVYLKSYEVASTTALTSEAWRTNAAEPLQGAVNEMLARLAAMMKGDMPKA